MTLSSGKLSVVCLVVCLVGSAAGVERHVPGDYATIQAAIDNCSSGDVVIIGPGTYSGAGNRDLDLRGKAVTVRGTAPDNWTIVDGTVIDCQGTTSDPHRGFQFSHGEGTSSVICGLTIQNGRQTYGGGIYCAGGSGPRVDNCTIQSNQASIDGGGVYCTGQSAPKVSNCRLLGNSARYGGGMYCNSSSPSVTGCTFTGNSVTSSGGAIACWGGNAAISNTLFSGNTADSSGGGVFCYSSSSPTISNCTFYGNSATMYGGGSVLCNGGSTPAVRNCILWNNLPQEVQLLSGTPDVRYSDVRGGWQGSGNINSDPLFADADHGDFHLKSTAGRWDPSANGGAGGWVTDTVTSPCIDGGNPADPATNESGQGQIVDMGNFGNTAFASQSPSRVVLTVNVVGGHGTVNPTGGSYFVGSAVTLTATPDAGYRVASWSGTDNDSLAGSNTNTVTMTDNKTVTVQFASAPSQTFSLTASVVGGHGSIIPQNGTFAINTQVPLTAIPDAGYRVKKWTGTDNDSYTAASNTVTMTQDKTVSVEFEAITYTLTINKIGVGTVTPAEGTYTYSLNEGVNLTATPDAGYRIHGWSGTDNDLTTNSGNAVTMTDNKTVTVTFELIPCSLQVSVVGGHGTASSDPSGATVSFGTLVIFTAAADSGYRVKDWTINGTALPGGANSTFARVTSDTTVTVEFEPVTGFSCVLTATVTGGNGELVPSGGLFDHLAVATLNAFPDSGYRVKRWMGTDNDSSTADNNTVTMTDNKTVTVEFERTYTLAVNVDGGHGGVSPAGGAYGTGERVMLTAVPDTGYRVLSWSGSENDPAAGALTNSVVMNSDRTVTVKFEPVADNSRTLTVNVVDGHGTVTPIGGTYPANAVVTLTAIPDSDYRVKQWTGTDNDNSTAATNTVMMDADNKSVTVSFELIKCQLTVIVSGSGTVTPESGPYDIHTIVALNATPADGYRLLGWFGTINDNSTLLVNSVKMDSNKGVLVTFVPITYTLNLSVNGLHGMLTSSPSGGTFASGTLVTLIAAPDSGYRVQAWSGSDNDPLAGSSTNLVRMTDNKTVSVTFEPIPQNSHTLTAQVNGGYGRILPGSGIYPDGSTVTLLAVPDDHYKVKRWVNTDNDSSTDDNNTITLTADKIVAVEFVKVVERYQLTAAVTGGHGTVSPISGIYDEGTQVVLTATPDAGYQVHAWTGTDFVPFAGSTSNIVTLYDNASVTVEFEPVYLQAYCTLQVNVTGGLGSVLPGGGVFASNSVVPLAASVQPGYRIKSWTGTENDNSTAASNSVTMSGNKTVTLTLETVPSPTHMLTVSVPTGHGSVIPSGGPCLAGSTVTLTAFPQPGYRVKDWSGARYEPAAGSNTNSVSMDADKTVVVEFETLAAASHSLTACVAGGNGTIYPTSGVYSDGFTVNLTATPATGHRVKLWTGTNNDNFTGASNSVAMTADKDVSVTFEPIPYTLYRSVTGSHGTLSSDPAGPTVLYDSTVLLTAHPDAGYRVKAWMGTDHDPSGGSSTNSVQVRGDTYVTVEFEPAPAVTYTLTASVSGGHGTVNPTTGTYDPGTVVALTATPDTGYRVKVWTGCDNASSLDDGNFVTMNGDHVVTVSFEPIPLGTLYVDTSPIKGIVTVDGQEWGVAPQTGQITVGDHTIHFGDVIGYGTPSSQTVTVSQGNTAAVAGTYEALRVLQVSPDGQSLGASAGGAGFTIANNGSGTMTWTAEVIEGADWLTFSSAATGTNSCSLTFQAAENAGPGIRIGKIRITATDTAGSPREVTVTQHGTAALGDINGDQEADVSDLILGLRMSVQLSVIAGGQTYGYPFPDWMTTEADMNGDGQVDIADIIKIQRRVIGLDP